MSRLTVVNDKGHRYQILLMFLHRLMTYRPPIFGRRRLCWSRDGRRGSVEPPLEILCIQPEAQVFLAKVGPQELSKQTPDGGLIEDLLESSGMTVFDYRVSVRTRFFSCSISSGRSSIDLCRILRRLGGRAGHLCRLVVGMDV